MLFTVMQQCKMAEKGTVLVRNVTCAPELTAVTIKFLNLNNSTLTPMTSEFWGTDGEQNLADALVHQFKSADHLRCIRHLQQNIERHLHEKGFPQSAIKQYAHDILGFTDK